MTSTDPGGSGGPDGAFGSGGGEIDMTTLVTALESLLTLASKQHVQVRVWRKTLRRDSFFYACLLFFLSKGVQLRRNLQSGDGSSPEAVPYIDGVKTEAEKELEKEVSETEAHIKRKLIEIHSRQVLTYVYAVLLWMLFDQ